MTFEKKHDLLKVVTTFKNMDIYSIDRSLSNFFDMFKLDIDRANQTIYHHGYDIPDVYKNLILPPSVKRISIDDIQLLYEHGKGAYGKILKGIYHPSTINKNKENIPQSFPVALKMFRSKNVCFDEIQNMLNIFTATENIQGIPKLIGVIDDNDSVSKQCGIVFEFITQTPITNPTSVAKNIIRSIRDLHAAHLRHQDIKPDNIIVHGSSAHIVDIGNVCKICDNDNFAFTQEYIPPTFNIATIEKYGPRGYEFDIYALGKTLKDMNLNIYYSNQLIKYAMSHKNLSSEVV